MRCPSIFWCVVLGWSLVLGVVRADEAPGLNLLRPDSLEGWQYGERPPAGWTIADGRLTGTKASTPLLSGWTFGDFELSFQWAVEGGAWKIHLPEVPAGEGLEIVLAEGEGILLPLKEGPQRVITQKADSLSGKLHQTRLVRQGDQLSCITDGRFKASITIPQGRDKSSNPVPAAQRRFGLGLAVIGGKASLQELRLREPRGESMFNGKDLTGWWCPGKIDAWGVQDGKIVWQHSGGDYLRSEREFGNFTFSCQYKAGKGTNSGVGIRTPRLGWPSGDGMEMQIWDRPLDQPIEQHQAMAIYGNVPPLARADRSEQWNDVVIKADGYMISAWMNGVLVQHYNTFRHPELKWRNLKGWIGFQDHNGKIEFRDIRVLPAPDGLGLATWYRPQPLSLQAQMIDRLMNSVRLAEADGFLSGVVSVKLGNPKYDQPPAPRPDKKKNPPKKDDTPKKAKAAPSAAEVTGKAEPAKSKDPMKPVSPQGDFVLAELRGPGAIVRIARTSNEGTLAFYFDGEAQPRLECKPADLRKTAPRLGYDASPTLTFLPYQKSVKVMLLKAQGAEYWIDYLTFPAGSPVETYRDVETGFPRAWLEALDYRWGQHSWGTVRQYDSLPRPACPPRSIEPGTTVPLVHVDGTGIVHWVKLEASRKVLDNKDLWLEVTLDGAKQPAIAAPARFWYAAAGNHPNFLFTESKGMIFRLAMPFSRGITFTARNVGTKPIEDIGLTTSVEPATDENRTRIAGLMPLRAKYYPAGNDSSTIFALNGAGRWVGLVYQQPAGQPMGIAGLTVDGGPRAGWAAADLNAFLGYLWPDKRYTTAGRKGPLGWRFLLLESLDFNQNLRLEATGPNLGERLVWYYGR